MKKITIFVLVGVLALFLIACSSESSVTSELAPETTEVPEESEAEPETTEVPEESEAEPETTEVPEESETEPETTEVPEESETEPEITEEPEPIYDPKALEIPDFLVEVESGRDPVILHLTDTQIIDAAQARSSGRIDSAAKEFWATDKIWERCYDYLTEVITATNPDYIILTGDVVYGEFDDNGTALTSFVEFMEGFQIPWSPVFGNHDNESKMGADWQCEQFENAEYCLFEQKTLTGNGNYSVGIVQEGVLKRVFYLLDSNGCSKASEESLANGHTKTKVGFGQDQIEWYTEEITALKELAPDVKISFAFHIQLSVFAEAYQEYGYSSSSVGINIDRHPWRLDGDFGYLGRYLKDAWDSDRSVWNGMKALGADSIFVGHEHYNSASVVYEGVRFQYGQKSSEYDRFNCIGEDGTITGGYYKTGTSLIGGTVFTLSEIDGSIEDPYIYYCGFPNGRMDQTEIKSEGERGMATIELWTGHGFDKLFLESEKPAEATNKYVVYTAKNETEGVQIALRTGEDVEGLHFCLSEMPSGVTAQVFQMYGVTKLHDVTYTDPAVPLLSDEAIQLRANETQPLLVEFTVAADAPAGEHALVLSILDADGNAVAAAEITLHVWDFSMPTERTFQTSVHTMATPRVEHYDLLLDHNFCARMLPVDILSDEADAYMSDPRVTCFFQLGVGDDAYLKAIYEKLKDHPEWLEKACFYALDEPRTLEMAHKLKAACERLRSLCPGFSITAPFYTNVQIDENTDQIAFMSEIIDIHCPKLSCWDDENIYSAEQAAKYPSFAERMKENQKWGDEVWAYVCNNPPKPYLNVRLDDEGIGSRVLFWQMYQREIDGFLYWNATYYDRLPEKDPWKCLDTFGDGIYGDGILIYPGEPVGVDGPVASIRLKIMRDGVDDIELFYLAEELFGRDWVVERVNKATSSLTSVDVTSDEFVALRREIGTAVEAEMKK